MCQVQLMFLTDAALLHVAPNVKKGNVMLKTQSLGKLRRNILLPAIMLDVF